MNIYKAIHDEISVENMLSTVHELVKWKRDSGTSDELEAFKFLKSKLDGYGYTTRLIPCETYISLPLSAVLTVNGKDIHAQTHSMDVGGHVNAPMVYCPDIADIEDIDCDGKIVVIEEYATYELIKAVQDRGAVGMIFVQEAVIRESILSACWGSPTTKDEDLFPHIPAASVADDDAAQMVDMLKRGETVIADLTTEVDTGWRNIPLLIADLKAPVESKRFIQFTGHCDSWYYGAVDNGTSNSMQIEIARIVKEHQSELKRNFRVVFFSGHSHGRYAGSTWYADHFFEDLRENCIANINSDCAGCVGADDVTRSIIMPEAKPLAVQIVRELTGETFEGMRCARLGDQSFWNIGVTSAFASFSRQKKKLLANGKMGYERGNSSLGPGWHTPDDLEKYISPANLLRDARIVGEYIMTCLTEPVVPMDMSQETKDIIAELEKWAHTAGDKFDLSETIEHTKRLDAKLERFMAAPLEDDVKNEVMLKLSRILVSVNFTSGDIYGNEAATDIDPVPVLTPIRKLVDPGTPQVAIPALKLELLRGCNFINHSMNMAEDLVDSVIM